VGLDALRAAAMLLGVLFHVGLAFVPVQGLEIWPLEDPASHPAYALLVIAIHAFRMPMFFLIAGWLAAGVLARRGPRALIRSRLARIGLPLLLSLIFIAPLVMVSGSWARVQTSNFFSDARTFPDMIADAFDFRPWWDKIDPVHLWFLWYLLLFTLLAAGLSSLARREPWSRWRALIARAFQRALASPAWCLCLALATLPFVLSMRSAFVDTPRSFVLMPPHILGYYFAFFASGWLLARQPDPSAILTRRPALWTIAGLVLATLATLFATTAELWSNPRWRHLSIDQGLLLRAFWTILASIATWACVLGLVAWALRAIRRETPTLRFLSDSAYWTYLVHVPLLWPIHLLVLWTPGGEAMPGPLRLLLVTVLVAAACLVTFIPIRQTALGRLLGARGPLRARAA
jgi:peptidoglycan/LPS O-acetylase OafA/YrhL